MIHDENGGKIPIYHFMCVKYAEYLASPLTLHLSLCSRMRKNNFSVRISHTQCFIALSPQLMASPFVATLPFPATALVDCIPTARRPLAAAGAATGGAAQAQSPLLLQSTTTTTTTASQKERERERRGGGERTLLLLRRVSGFGAKVFVRLRFPEVRSCTAGAAPEPPGSWGLEPTS